MSRSVRSCQPRNSVPSDNRRHGHATPGWRDVYQECLAAVKRFAEPDYTPLESDFEQLASQLSMVGFFVEAMQHGSDDYDIFVKQAQVPSGGADKSAEDAIGASVEQEVAQARLETHALLSALKGQPEDAGLREEIRQNLETLKNDADLVADTVWRTDQRYPQTCT